MRNQTGRILMTFVIWAVAGFVAVGYFATIFMALWFQILDGSNIGHLAWPGAFVIIGFAIAAAIGTVSIWSDASKSEAISRAEEANRKAKHSSRERIERLMETLDDDEIIELETLMMAQQNGLE